MKKNILALLGVILICSCGGNSGNRSSSKNANYFDRDVSIYATGASGVDEKIVFHRDTKEYQYYMRAAVYNSSEWTLEDKGLYKESFDENSKTVTCSLDNSKVKGNERLGTVHTVKINLETRTAQFISIANTTSAKEVSE